jgi:hypothetical protein
MIVITHIFTGADNQTVDVGRVSWAVSLAAVITAGIHTAWVQGHVDLVAFGTAIAAVVAAHGAALGFKANTEPK